MTPIENSRVKTIPSAASPYTRRVLLSSSVSQAVTRPIMAAPISIGTTFRLAVIRKASTRPGRTACEMASPSIAFCRSTSNEPIRPHEAAVKIAVSMTQAS